MSVTEVDPAVERAAKIAVDLLEEMLSRCETTEDRRGVLQLYLSTGMQIKALWDRVCAETMPDLMRAMLVCQEHALRTGELPPDVAPEPAEEADLLRVWRKLPSTARALLLGSLARAALDFARAPVSRMPGSDAVKGRE